MRTTLNIDDDVFEQARSLADARRISRGKALSEMARRGMHARPVGVSKSAFFTFAPQGAPSSFGPEDIKKALERSGL